MFFIGQGIDYHQIKKNRPLILGGVLVSKTNGLLGHSDGDIILHSICDSLLGAMQEKDLGFYFPSNDKKNKNISSIKILNFVLNLLRKKKYQIINIDLTLISDVIFVNQYHNLIIDKLKHLLKCDRINIKGKSTDGLLRFFKKKYVIVQSVVLIKSL